MDADEVVLRLRALPGWSLEEGPAIGRRYRLPDFARAFELVRTIAALAEAADHHPDHGLGWGYVTVRLRTHDIGGLGQKDFHLAAQIQAMAPSAPEAAF